MSSPFKVNTRSQWATLNPVLMAGEPGLESDTNNLKIGNGRSSWASLPYHGCPGYWGSFWDSTSQVAALADTAYAIKLRQADAASRGVKIISNERITVDHAGVYSLTFSIQFSNTDTRFTTSTFGCARTTTAVLATCRQLIAGSASSAAMAASLATCWGP
jgi:hypothetical protein